MKKTYEKPFSTVVQMATENIIAASEVYSIIGGTLEGPEDITNIIGESTGEVW